MGWILDLYYWTRHERGVRGIRGRREGEGEGVIEKGELTLNIGVHSEYRDVIGKDLEIFRDSVRLNLVNSMSLSAI